MRKGIALAAVAAVALAVPGTAGAGQGKKRYSGRFESTGTLTFTIRQAKNGKRVFSYKWKDFPLDCQGTPRTSTDKLNFSVEVKDRKFEARAVDDQDDPGALLKLKGEQDGPFLANGTMSIEGKRVSVDGGGRKRCDSGKVSWAASTLADRGA